MKTQYLINTLELSGAILLSEQGFQVMFHCLQAVMVVCSMCSVLTVVLCVHPEKF